MSDFDFNYFSHFTSGKIQFSLKAAQIRPSNYTRNSSAAEIDRGQNIKIQKSQKVVRKQFELHLHNKSKTSHSAWLVFAIESIKALSLSADTGLSVSG